MGTAGPGLVRAGDRLVILATARGDIAHEARDANLGALIQATGGTLRSQAGIGVTAREVAGLPACTQAIRIAAESMAKHTLYVWRGEDVDRRKVKGSWQARLFAGQPNPFDSWFLVWEGTEASLTARWNAFWLKRKTDGRVSEVTVLHPDTVEGKWDKQLGEPVYHYRDRNDRWSEWVGRDQILHFRVGSPSPGSIFAPSPIEWHRRTWAGALAKNRAEEILYTKGQMKSTAVVFPEKITPDQADRWKQVYLGPGGVDEASQVKVFGGGPTLSTIGLSLQDSQFIESMAFTIEDIGRMLGVPPSLLWAASREGDKPLTPEHEEDRWWRYGLEPRRMRIEQTIKADVDFFGPGARDFPEFLIGGVRGDVRTESETLVNEVQAGLILVDEARAKRGQPPLPPVPEDPMQTPGMVPQITPVGGAPNPNTPPPVPPAPQTASRSGGVDLHLHDTQIPLDEVIDAVRQLAKPQQPPVVNVPAPIVNVRAAPAVDYTPVLQELADKLAQALTEMAAAQPNITVQVPEQPAPLVVVQPGSTKSIEFKRDPFGRMSGATIEAD